MLKRTVIFSVILATLAMFVLVPMNVAADSEYMPEAQTTVEVTVSVQTAAPADETPAPGIPVTGGGFAMTTIIILGLLGLLGVAIIIGGAALLNRRQ